MLFVPIGPRCWLDSLTMIFDTISHLPQYLPQDVWKDLESFLSRLCPDAPEGQCEIRKSEIFAQISSYKTRLPSKGHFETHDKYVDVQIVLSGMEMIDVVPRDALIPDTDYDEQNDICFYKTTDVHAVRLPMVPSHFAMFFPQDAHDPQLAPPTGVQNVKKVVIKIEWCLLRSDRGYVVDKS